MTTWIFKLLILIELNIYKNMKLDNETQISTFTSYYLPLQYEQLFFTVYF